MENVFYSPEGNPEVWDTKPDGYFTEEEWEAWNPLQPDEVAIFNETTREWEFPDNYLEIVKERKLVQIIASRNNAIDTEGAEYKNLHFWSDKGSKSDIQFALMAYDEEGHLEPYWKAQDGILAIESRDDLKGIAKAIGEHVAAQYAKEFALTVQVNVAQTIEEVNSIIWG